MRSVLFIAAFGLLGCEGECASLQRPGCESPIAFVSHVLDTLRAYSLYRDSADWDQIQEEAQVAVAGATSIDQTYRTIDRVLTRSGDDHAWFRRPVPPGRAAGDIQASHLNPTSELIDGQIGYMIVPAVMGRTVSGEKEYASMMQASVRRLDGDHLRGWIVDLRRNWGGNMWPMLAGVGPLLGPGVAGYFVYSDGTSVAWLYDDGAVRLGDSTLVNLEDGGYEPVNSRRPIAVLVGEGTTSSGEAIVVAFRGLPHARSFGTRTSGMSTSIEGKHLCDGSMVGISTARFADRNGNIHGGELSPDVLVDHNDDGSGEVMEAAKRWIIAEVERSSRE